MEPAPEARYAVQYLEMVAGAAGPVATECTESTERHGAHGIHGVTRNDALGESTRDFAFSLFIPCYSATFREFCG